MRSYFTLLAVLAASCLAMSSAMTQCEEHRERELKSTFELRIIPKCTPEGDYEAKQCFEGHDYCMCFHTDGTFITTPIKSLKTCACHVHRYKELVRSDSGIDGNFVPSCNDDGTYAKKQCHASTGYCWCSDEEGTRITEETREDIDC